MSTLLDITLSFIAKQISIYIGISILILGTVGGILTITIFISLQTFRQSSCAFYLLIMQVFNTGQLFSGLLSSIIIIGFGIDLTQTSRLCCKLRYFSIELCTLMSITCLCLATIDQYFATCSRPSWQRWSNFKLAHRLIIIFSIIWFLHGTLYMIYTDIIQLPSGTLCTISSYTFLIYNNYIMLLTFTGILPFFILIIFGCLAYHNVRQLNYRTIPLVRQELDKQLTAMVLLQVLLNFVSLIPYIIIFSFLLIAQIMKDPVAASYFKFFYSLCSIIFYIYFAGSFYIYICASERFRRQLIYVVTKMHFKRCQHQQATTNQVVPQV